MFPQADNLDHVWHSQTGRADSSRNHRYVDMVYIFPGYAGIVTMTGSIEAAAMY